MVAIFASLIAILPLLRFTNTLNPQVTPQSERDVSGASGKVFKGSKIRNVIIEHSTLISSSFPSAFIESRTENTTYYDCKNWAVCTTIFEPSHAVFDMCASYKDYCLIVVADLKTPSNYSIHGGCTFVYLSVEKQKALRDSAFASSLAWNHFGRKNLGYLYAIANGAERVWDFDDDNQLIGAMDLRTFHVMNHTAISVLTVAHDARRVLNPYPALGSTTFAWPRGFPLDEIRSNKTIQSSELFVKPLESSSNIAVIQALADVDPDVDAIYRLQREILFFLMVILSPRFLKFPAKHTSPSTPRQLFGSYAKRFGVYICQ